MTSELRNIAMHAFNAGVAAANPALALDNAFKNNALPMPKAGGKRIFIAFGKAAIAMMRQALAGNGDVPFKALAVTNYENVDAIEGCQVMASGHPVPDENGLMATHAVLELVGSAQSKDVVIVLISGGGSALLPAPREGLTLQEKMAVNDLLLKNNFEITEMNLVRQNLSCLKGGKLTALAAPAPVTGYILSDVIGDDLNVVASGPTAGAIGSAQEAVELLQSRGVWEQMPPSAKELLSNDKTEVSGAVSATNFLIGSNTYSAKAMARAAGAELQPEPLVGEVSEAVETCLKTIKSKGFDKPFALAWGGETTVLVKGDGKGGRNQEMALRFAEAFDGDALPGEWCFLSGATDGRDGPTDAAGGLVDGGTKARIAGAGVDMAGLLENNDSYAALKAAGDLIDIGATGTNVADLQLFFYQP